MVVLFAWAYPTHFLIADEVAYFEQAIEWAGASPSVISDYPPGTALVAAGLIGLFGPKAVFLCGIGAFLVGIWALAGMLCRLDKPVVWALYPALFLPGLVLTRTLMSDLPSFALACIFLRLYIQPTGQPVNQSTSQPINLSTSQPVNQPTSHPANQSPLFAAGLVAGLSVLFRETNLLWALPFLVGAVWRARGNPTPNPSPEGEGSYIQTYLKYFMSGCIHSQTRIIQIIRDVAPLPPGGGVGGGVVWLGFIIGFLPRPAWGWFSFGDPFFVRDSGIAFSVAYLPQNLSFYLFALLVLMPGGLYFLVRNKSPYRWETTASVLLFLGVYGCYGYDAFTKSGWKGLVLQGRFLLPLLPFVALAAAETMPVVGRGLRYGIAAATVLLFAGVQFVGHAYNLEQQRITDALLRLPAGEHLTFTPDESRKYLNALHTPRLTTSSRLTSAEPLIICRTTGSRPTNPAPTQNSKPKTQNCYAHLITRSDSADRIKKTAEAETAFQRYFHGAKTTLLTDLTIRDGTRLRIWRIRQTDHNE
ncbi:MAG: hypothetical protein JNJ90_21245 [Saprospiraceae bacterium]|nr:hypothetical protein [Saprospiraceae bacterium]